MKYVHFARGRYEARVTVPLELRAIIGKRELKGNRGADKQIAERKAHGTIAGFLAMIEDAAAQLIANSPTVHSAALAHYTSELEADDGVRAALGSRSVASTNSLFAPHRAALLRRVVAGQVEAEEAEALIGYAADVLEAEGKAPARGVVGRADLLRALAEVQLEAMTRVEERDHGRIAMSEPKSAFLNAPPVAVARPTDRGTGDTISEMLPRFHKERTSGNRTLATKTMQEHVVAVRMFEQVVGKVPVRSITRADMLNYKRVLLETPARSSIRFRGLTIPQAIKANAKRTTPFETLDPQTINMKWLSHISTILQWGSNNGEIEQNPARGVRVDEGNGFKEPPRVPFSQDDIRALFSTDLFKTPATYTSKQWALLVALYTGARSSSEIARINLADVREEQGIAVVELTEASKNLRSRRIVPVHKFLLDLGFLEYVDKLRAKGNTRLFPDWIPEDKINRWFLRTYKASVGIVDSRKVFHSFRNTLKTELAKRSVNRDVSDLITGHKDQSVGGTYISDHTSTMIQMMADALNRADFALPIVIEHKTTRK